MSERLNDERLNEIRQFLSWNPPHLEPQSAPELAISYLSQALTELDRLRVEISKCSESFDKLSTQYHEARERWREKMERTTAQVAALRPIAERAAYYAEEFADFAEGVQASEAQEARQFAAQARALLAEEGDAPS
jgi:hypothetical protein